MPIDLTPGHTIRRTALHEEYGGRRQGGISPSKVSANVFVITAPDKGELHGYLYDGPRDDGYWHYTGEGQFGDQRMVQGNRAIRDHEAEGRELHVFSAFGTELTYIGQFRYVDHYTADAPETNNGPTRTVIVFRLAQLSGDRPPGPRSRLDRLGADGVKEVPVEDHLTEKMLIEGDGEPYESERREQRLVRAFLRHLESEGHDVCRLQLRPDGEAAPIYCDLFDKDTRTLYEAKGSVARPAFRMAIGQLADYSRLVRPAPSSAILVPQKPRADLLALAASQGVRVIYADGNDFVWETE